LHHIISIFGELIALYLGIGDFFVGYFFIVEVSTPFLHINWFFDRIFIGFPMYLRIINYLITVFMFLLVRIIFLPYVLHLYAVQHHLASIFEVIFHIPKICAVSTTTFLIINVYWFVRIIQMGKRKMFGEKRVKKEV